MQYQEKDPTVLGELDTPNDEYSQQQIMNQAFCMKVISWKNILRKDVYSMIAP